MVNLRLASFFLLMVLCFSTSLGQESIKQKGLPFLNQYNPEVFKAEGTIYSIAQDQRGIMYFGANGGVVEFDGTNWNYISLPNRTEVFSLCVASDGTVYVGGQNDFGRLQSDSAGNTYYTSLLDRAGPDAPVSMTVYTIHELGEEIFFTTSAAVYRWDGSNLYEIKPNLSYHHSFMVRGEYWVKEEGKGIMRWDGEQLQLIPGSAIFANTNLYAIEALDEQRVLLMPQNDKLYTWDGSRFRPYNLPPDSPLAQAKIYSSQPYGKDKLVIATLDNGVFITDNKLQPVLHLNSTQGLANDIIFEVYIDQQKNLWIGYGSDDGIAYVQLNSPFSIYDERHQLDGPVFCAAEFEGDLYIGATKGLYRKPWGAAVGQTQVQNTIKEEPFELVAGQKSQTLELLNTTQGQLLAAHRLGVTQIKNKQATPVIEGLYVGDLHQMRKAPNRILAAHRNGIRLLSYGDGVWQDSGLIRGFQHTSSVRGWTIGEDKNGNIWIPTDEQGIYRLTLSSDMSTFTTSALLSTKEGLPSNSNNRVQMIGGELLFLTEKGIYRYDQSSERFGPDSRFQEINRRETYVRAISEGTNGDLWYWGMEQYTDRSKSKGFRPNFEAGLLIYDPVGTSYHLNLESLNRVSQFFLSPYPQITPIDEANVLFNSGSGFVHYQASQGLQSQPDFMAMIRRVENTAVAEDSVVYGGANQQSNVIKEGSFPFAYNSLRFTSTAPAYEATSSITFQYLLEGFDQNWSAWTNKNQKEYTNLREGDYTFHVRAKNIHKQISTEATYQFTILAPWYRTTTAYVIGIFLLIVIVYGLVMLNTRRLQREKTVLESMVRERTEEVQKQNRDLEKQKQEIARQKESITQQNEELVELNAEKNHLIGVVAHDLRSPLNHIKGLGSLLSILSDNLTKEQKQYVTEIINSVDRLQDMISKILDIDAIEQKKTNLKLAEVKLNETLEHLIETYQQAAEAKRIILHFEQVNDTESYLLDEQYLIQVVENLLSNAIKFSEFDKNVYVRLTHEPAHVTIEVKDEGPGFREEELQKLFGKFQRFSARPTNGENSVGLGLSIVKKYVEAMDGMVWCVSEPKKGATFFIRFHKVKEH